MADLTIQNQKIERETRPEDDGMPRLGDWYWVTEKNYKGETVTFFGCVMGLGSNYAELQSPPHDGSYHHTRIHIDDFDAALVKESDPEAHIAGQTARYQKEVADLMQEVRGVYSSRGVTPSATALADHSGSSTALATLNGQVDVKQYENALILAKNETLPELFKKIKEANKGLAKWMMAPTLPMKAMVGPLEAQIEGVTDRIFNISLYAGLTEQVELINPDSAPAAMGDKLHVMQRRLYMDEECLYAYEAGGMEFKDIRQFDAWLAKPENRDRLLPFPRTLAAFRVRRAEKERDSEGNILTAFVNIQIAQSDKYTYLYIRNGEQVWRMSCEMDFGSMIFPDDTDLKANEPMMVKMFGSRVDRLMPTSRYEFFKARYEANDKARQAWDKAHSKEEKIRNPFGWMRTECEDDKGHNFYPGEWSRFDPSNVYYDETMASIEKQVKEYNRVALIIQGLFDRSEVLHPHPPVRSWTDEGFAASITLVHDGKATLYGGEKPDFEAYRKRLNRHILVGSVVTGADAYWARAEAAKESKRRDNDWRDKSDYRPKTWRPYGNPGPGVLAVVAGWKPVARSATFRWKRKAAAYGPNYGHTYDATITINSDHLLNVSAYKPGDFQQFYRDPRTRQEYLKWAPLLLMAEDYHAGKRTAGSRPEDAEQW